MTDAGPPVSIRDDRAEARFVVEEGDAVAELVYDDETGTLVLLHTEVPAAFRHRGVGGELVKAAIRRARDERRTLVPWCPFARRWLLEHPDETAGVPVDWSLPDA